MTHEAGEFEGEMNDSRSESVRAAVEHQVEDYVKAHYPNGSTSIYGSSNGNQIEITVCIEDHEFQSRNHWGGRWPCGFDRYYAFFLAFWTVFLPQNIQFPQKKTMFLKVLRVLSSPTHLQTTFQLDSEGYNTLWYTSCSKKNNGPMEVHISPLL